MTITIATGDLAASQCQHSVPVLRARTVGGDVWQSAARTADSQGASYVLCHQDYNAVLPCLILSK